MTEWSRSLQHSTNSVTIMAIVNLFVYVICTNNGFTPSSASIETSEKKTKVTYCERTESEEKKILTLNYEHNTFHFKYIDFPILLFFFVGRCLGLYGILTEQFDVTFKYCSTWKVVPCELDHSFVLVRSCAPTKFFLIHCIYIQFIKRVNCSKSELC